MHEQSKPSGSENRKSRIPYLVENQRNVLFTGEMAIVSIICGLRDFRWFSLALATLTAPKCSSRGQQCGKLAANSQNTLELKTEEWVSG